MDTFTAFLISLLAIPVMKGFNRWSLMADGMALFLASSLVLVVIVLLTMIVLRLRSSKGSEQPVNDWFVYVFTLFSFTAVVDLFIGLELTGVVDDYMVFYFREGEPYLVTAHGMIINYWDGIGHNLMYLLLIYFITNRKKPESYRTLGLYWVGSIVNSMPVLLGGAVIGMYSHKVKPSFFLNTPYVLCPLYYGFRTLKTHRTLPPAKVQNKQKSAVTFLLDIVLSVGLFLCVAVNILRAGASLGSQSHYFSLYTQEVEPYLLSPTKFPTVQVLLNFFYQIPACVAAIYALRVPGCGWLPDLASLMAGAAIQGQLSYMVSSLHSLTPEELRVPLAAQGTFWLVNLLLLIVPHILLIRCITAPQFFAKSEKRLE